MLFGRMSGPSLPTDKDETICPECDERGKAMCIVLGRGLRTIHYHCLMCRVS